MIVKCMLAVMGAEAKEACRTEQLCEGLEYGTEGGIHAVRLLWQHHNQEEDWGFLLIDARNAFNENNHKDILWAVRSDWPSGARFAFNCYRRWATIVFREGDGTGHLPQIK